MCTAGGSDGVDSPQSGPRQVDIAVDIKGCSVGQKEHSGHHWDA
jgi:hypothetical protein